MEAATDTASAATLAHTAAGGKGVVFGPNDVQISHDFSVLGGILTAKGGANLGVTLKTGAITAKLTTDGVGLVVDRPVSATALTTGGVLTAASGSISGTLTVTTLNVTGVLTYGDVAGTTATIGTVQISETAVGGAGIINAPAGLQSGVGMFYGDGTYGYFRQRAVNKGGFGSAYLAIAADHINSYGDFYVRDYLRITGGRGVPWHRADGTHTAWIAPVIFSAGDPGAGSYPDGTLWIS